MNQYEQALNRHNSARALIEGGIYQQGIYHCCLAAELYFKSVPGRVKHYDGLEVSHDIVGMYNAVSKKYGKNDSVTEAVKL